MSSDLRLNNTLVNVYVALPVFTPVAGSINYLGLGKRELIYLLSFTYNYVVSVR